MADRIWVPQMPPGSSMSIHIVTFPRSTSPALYASQFLTQYTPFGSLVLRSSLRIFPPTSRESTQSNTKLAAVSFRLLRVNVSPTSSSRIYATTPGYATEAGTVMRSSGSYYEAGSHSIKS
jgi:hypothetical protein